MCGLCLSDKLLLEKNSTVTSSGQMPVKYRPAKYLKIEYKMFHAPNLGKFKNCARELLHGCYSTKSEFHDDGSFAELVFLVIFNMMEP